MGTDAATSAPAPAATRTSVIAGQPVVRTSLTPAASTRIVKASTTSVPVAATTFAAPAFATAYTTRIAAGAPATAQRSSVTYAAATPAISGAAPAVTMYTSGVPTPVPSMRGQQVGYVMPGRAANAGATVIPASPGVVTRTVQAQPRLSTVSAAVVTQETAVVEAKAEAPAQWRVKLGAEMPNFPCTTTHGDFTFHEYLDCDPEAPWTILFSHPKDFTPVCTTELGRCETLVPNFAERRVKLIGISCDPVDSHIAWSGDILHREGIQKEEPFLSFPIIADESKELVAMLGMLDPEEMDSAGLPLPARALIVIGPDKKVKLSILYPATTGRNFEEVVRVIDSLQLTAGAGLATPADWRQGDRCIVAPSISTEDAEQRFTNLVVEDLPSGKQYLRHVDCPLQQAA